MRLFHTTLAVAALCLPPLCAQKPDFSTLEQSAAAELARLHIPGASIAIVRGGEVIYSKGIGIANVETGEPVRPEMLFRLGSTTKMMTAAALTGLAVEGKIDLNAPIGKYVSGLTPMLARVTANQLLSHTAGLHDEAPMQGSHDDAALGSGIRAWTDAWFFTAPGKIISYANPGYWVTGYLVEVLTGKPYADAMEERVFRPLGMARTTLRPTMAMTYPLAQGHETVEGKSRIVRPAADNSSGWPAGSIFSNTADLSRFVIAFMNDGRIDGRQVLDPQAIALQSAPHAAIPGSTQSYGYGLETGEWRGVHVVRHSGSRAGYGSEIRMAPKERVAVIVQTNRSGATLPETADKALEMLLPLSPTESTKKSALPLTGEDLRRNAGTFRNGDERIEIVARQNRLYLKRGAAAEAPMIKYGESDYGLEKGATSFIMVRGADGKTEYLHSGLRSFARER
ncbi:MAG: serine hydrolase [Candidatus Sulfopaludibacter sp.]|nr:serine hydrolase [Candidatus Sulfopaludibacter sp.]